MSLFISGQIQKQTKMRRQHEIQFEQMLISNSRQKVLNVMSEYEVTAAKKDKSVDDLGALYKLNGQNVYYAELERLDEKYELQLDAFETELEVLDADIKSLDSMVQNGAKEGTWWCVGN